MSEHIKKRIDLPDLAGSIVLCDWMAEEVKDGQNLMRIDAGGRVLWKAKPPQGKPDCFTGVDWDGRILTANTWSCYLCSVDLANGEVTVLAFTK